MPYYPNFQQQNQLGDQEMMVNNQKIGMNSKLKLNVKTAIWIMGILWTILATFYTWTWISEKSDRKIENKKIYKIINKMAEDVHQIDLKTSRIEGQLNPIINKTSNISDKIENQGGTIIETRKENSSNSSNSSNISKVPPNINP